MGRVWLMNQAIKHYCMLPLPSKLQIFPETLEPLGVQLSVSDGVLDVLVPEVCLDGPGVNAPRSQLEALCVP